jgi:hypothetical protein
MKPKVIPNNRVTMVCTNCPTTDVATPVIFVVSEDNLVSKDPGEFSDLSKKPI